MKEEQENEQENAEQYSESSSNFLGEIPESWKRRARAAFGYTFCVTILIVVSCEIAVVIFPTVQWLVAVLTVMRHLGYHLYHYGVGLGVAIIAPCLVWEHIMYIREKRRREREQRAREREQRAREQAEAVVEELRARVSALEQERLAREQAEVVIAQLQKEVAALRRELDATNAHTPMPRDGKEN